MRGLGSSVYPRNIAYDAFDEIHWVNAAEAVSVCRELARTSYATGGWSVGCVGLVARWLARTRPADESIVAVFCDGPERYWNTVYDDDFCREHGLLGVATADHPDEIGHPSERDVTRWTRCTISENPRRADPSAGATTADARTEGRADRSERR